jgi:hypothetical protein
MRRRFLYYLPGSGGCSEKMLQSLGLYDRFIAPGAQLGPWVVRAWEGGPDGGQGCLVAAGNRVPEYISDAQVWENAGAYWVGIEDLKAPPGPADLRNPVGMEGRAIALGDGGMWSVPLIWKWNPRTCEHDVAVPQRLQRKIIDGRPKMSLEVVPAYRPLTAIAGEVWNSYCMGTPLTVDQVFENATALLGVNYRLGLAEVNLLGLLTVESAQKALSAAIDMESIERQASESMAAGLIDQPQVADDDEIASAGGHRG